MVTSTVWMVSGGLVMVAPFSLIIRFSDRKWAFPLAIVGIVAGALAMFYGAFLQDQEETAECRRLGGLWVAESGTGALCVDGEGKVKPW